MMLDLIQVFLIVSTLVIFLIYRKKMYTGPPYVTGLPLLGYMPFLGKETYLSFQHLMEKHGPIFSLHLGSLYTVVLGTYDVVYEAYVIKGNNFNQRPPYLVFKVFEYETGFTALNGEDWKVTRNFAMNILKKMGFGKTHSEIFLQAEISNFISEIKSYEGKPLNVEHMVTQSTNSLIMSLFTGIRREHDDPWQVKIIQTASDLVKSYSHDIGGMFPWMKKIPFLCKFSVNEKTRILKTQFWDLWDEEIERQKKIFSQNNYLDSFIHEWLTEQQRRNQKDDIHKHLFSDFYLRNNLDYLLQASADTTSVTLLWALLYLITNPDIQNKVYEDIDEIIGKERFPVLEDMKNLNYTRAFIMEVHRRATIVPMSLFHSNKTDDEIRGYHIPKDSVIINNTWSVHHDPKYFPDPYQFNPERFLDEQGKVKPCEYLSPFSIGRRMCPGKSVAEIQIFLYLTSIVQAYELKAPPGSNITDKNFSFDKGIVRRPASFEVLFVSRYN